MYVELVSIVLEVTTALILLLFYFVFSNFFLYTYYCIDSNFVFSSLLIFSSLVPNFG